jgi:hypothetical protein
MELIIIEQWQGCCFVRQPRGRGEMLRTDTSAVLASKARSLFRPRLLWRVKCRLRPHKGFGPYCQVRGNHIHASVLRGLCTEVAALTNVDRSFYQIIESHLCIAFTVQLVSTL